MPNASPEAGRANAGASTPEAAPRLNPTYSNLHNRWLKVVGRELAAVLQQGVNDEVAAQGEHARASLEAEAGAQLTRKVEEISSNLETIAFSLQNINPEDPVAAIEQANARGQLHGENYTRVLSAALELRAELRHPQVELMAYQLKTGNLKGNTQEFQQKTQANSLENPLPSAELKTATDGWMLGRDVLLKAYSDKEKFTADAARLRKEIKELQNGNDAAALSAKEGELQMLENKLIAVGIGAKEAKLKRLQEQLKAELINEFRKDKGAFMQVNRAEFIAQWRRDNNIPANVVMDMGQEDLALKKMLNQELVHRSSKVIAESIKYFDDDLANKRKDQIESAQEKGRIQKFLESWQKMPTWKRLAIGAGLSGAAASGLAVWGGATLLGAVAATGTYKVARSLFGAGVGIGLNAVVQKIAGNWFGKERGKLREQRVGSIESQLQADINTRSTDFLETEANRLRWAEIIDNMVDEQRRQEALLNKKEKKSRWILAGLYGVLGGLTGGLALDYVTGGELPGLSKKGKEKWWEDCWDKNKAPKPPAGLPVFEGEDPFPKGTVAPPISPEGELSGSKGGSQQPGWESADEVHGTPAFKAETTLGGRGIWGGVEEILKEKAKTDPALAEVLKDPAKSTYLVDMIKDKVVANPNEFLSGPGKIFDVDRIPGGTKMNITSILEDAKLKAMVEESSGLSKEAIDSINRNNAKIRQWVMENPGKPLTTPQVDEILRGRPATGGVGGPNDVTQPQLPDTSELEKTARAPIGTTEPPTATPEAGRGGGTVLPADAGTEQGGGTVLEDSTKPKGETPFGSIIEKTIAEKAGFRPEEYDALKKITVDKLLKEIPDTSEGQADMWRKFSRNNPPKLPHPGIYYETILRKQVSLADAIYKLEPNQMAKNLTVEQFINQFGDKLEIKRSPLLWR